MDKVIISWSGGKDSARALYELRKNNAYEIVALLTTVTEGYDRISMHGVRRGLLERQAESLGIRLETILITPKATNEEYEAKMKEKLLDYKDQGVRFVAVGDIFLEDLRRHREENLAKIGMKGIFPIWKQDTAQLAREFIGLGFKAVISCVDTEILDGSFAGREYTHAFLDDLPAHVDPCGERGEFHSFVYAGPIFRQPVPCARGEIVLRDDRFCFCDLISPSMEPSSASAQKEVSA
jgi:uncharacterized protein (TIGR00290 family)